MVLHVIIDGDPVCPFVTYLAFNLLSMNIGADSNIGRVGPSSSGGSNSVSSVAGKGGGNMSSVGDGRGNNVVIGCGQGGGNMVVGCGQGGGNMVVGGGQRRGNGIGGSKRSNIGVDQSGVSLSLTLDNMLNWTVLGNIFRAIDTIGHSSVVVGVVVAGDSVAGNSGDNGGNSVDIWGSKSSDKWSGNMAVRVGSSSISGSVRGVSIAVDQSRVSLSLTLGNEASVVERANDGGGVCTIDTKGPGVGVGTISGVRRVSTISRDVLSIRSGFRLGHNSGGKSENYKHLHGAGGCW